MNRKKPFQVSVRFDEEFYERLQAACQLQEHAEGQLARILVEWALPFYELTKSVKKLREIAFNDMLAGPPADPLQAIFEEVSKRYQPADGDSECQTSELAVK